MDGQIKTVYLRDRDVENVQRHAEVNGRSFSWALRDLVRKGLLADVTARESKEREPWTN